MKHSLTKLPLTKHSFMKRSPMFQVLIFSLGGSLGGFLGGCMLGPNYEKPPTDLPHNWPNIRNQSVKSRHGNDHGVYHGNDHGVYHGNDRENDRGNELEKPLPLRWWESFQDPLLTALIDEALKANANTLLAMARVAKARAGLCFREADLLPEFGVSASANRLRGSKEILQAERLPRTSNAFSLAGLLTYEIDLWGRLARAEESARAQLLSKIYAEEAVRLTVSADVALSYFNLQALEEKRLILEQTIAAWEESSRLQKRRFEQGLISQLDFLQTKSALAGARAELPAIEQKVIEQMNGLSVLLGRSPKELVEKRREGLLPHPLSRSLLHPHPYPFPLPRPFLETSIPSIPLEAPTTLLEGRPDIQAAEQDLMASNANMGEIKASYFPRLSLSALLGLQSNDLARLFNGDPKQRQLQGSIARALSLILGALGALLKRRGTKKSKP